jgi:hypothetical protein
MEGEVEVLRIPCEMYVVKIPMREVGDGFSLEVEVRIVRDYKGKVEHIVLSNENRLAYPDFVALKTLFDKNIISWEQLI